MAVNLSAIKDLLLPGLRGVEGQYEQIWNAAQLEHHGMGCWYGKRPASAAADVLSATKTLDEALEVPFNHEMHEKLLSWFRNGARTCFERILSCGDERRRRRTDQPAS